MARFDAGTVMSPGVIAQGDEVNASVKVVEFHARASNEGFTYIGRSDVSLTNGRELDAGETLKIDFGDGSVQFGVFEVVFSGGANFLDWTAVLAN